MKNICLYFQIHQPFRYRRYRFFDIGQDHYYYDDYTNDSFLRKMANLCYLPANKIINDLIKEYGCKFKVAFSISGTTLDQFELYAPDVLESFQNLAKSNCVEFLAETYSHSLSSCYKKEVFEQQVKEHEAKIVKLFGKKPTVFRNSELIYNNEIGEWVANMGYKGMITEGAKHILGWKSPNYVYCNANNPRLKLLLKNYRLCDDIVYNFSNKNWSEFPLTSEKYVSWLNQTDPKDETINLFFNYETFGAIHTKESGIFEFLKAFPKMVFSKSNLEFSTPSEIIENHQPVGSLYIPHSISWTGEARDTSAWLGNELQNEAFNKLYLLNDKLEKITDLKLITDWKNLQSSDHFFFMGTKFFKNGSPQLHLNPYNSPYEAFINYMNILSDFELRVINYGENQPIEERIDLPKKKSKAKVETEKVTKKIEKPLTQKSKTTKKTTIPVKNSSKKLKNA